MVKRVVGLVFRFPVLLLLAVSMTACTAVDSWLRLPGDFKLQDPESPSLLPATITSVDDDYVSISLTDTPTINWVAGVPLNSGDTYEVAIGTTSGGTNVLTWTSAGTATTFSTTGLTLALNATYYASVRVRTSSGNTIATVNADGWKVVATATNAARYSIAPNWNDYALTATPTSACVGTENGYFTCLHGGEKRRVPWSAAANCTGFAVTDELGAFDWACDQTGGAGNVFFYTRGLKKSKGLADLVNATAWKPNRIVLTSAGVPIAATARSAWWTNTVMALPPSTVAGTSVALLNSNIYTVASNTTVVGKYAGFPSLSQTKIGIVTLPGATLTLSASAAASTVLFDFTFSNYFEWLEGDFAIDRADGTLYSSMGHHSVVRRVRVAGFGSCVGNSTQMNSSFVSQIYATRCANGITAKGHDSTYQDLVAIGNSWGIEAGDSSNNLVFQNILVANNSTYGLYTHGLTDSNFIGVTAVNNSALGLYGSLNTGTTYQNIFVRNGGGFSLLMGATETVGPLVTDSLSLSFQNNSKFTSNLIIVNATANCSVSGGTNPGLVTTTCANQGTSNKTLSLNATKGDLSFVGQINTTDTANQTNTNGTNAFSASMDWFRFSNPLRGWGKGGTYPSAGTQGSCTTGTCQIWDFMLKASDVDLKNVTGDGSTQNAAFVAGAACPSAIGGNVTSTNVNGTPRTYLTNAMEVQGRGGNNNGLCESNETCLYLPNYGAYQGSGDFSSNACNFSNGTVTGVTMLAYPVN